MDFDICFDFRNYFYENEEYVSYYKEQNEKQYKMASVAKTINGLSWARPFFDVPAFHTFSHI